MRIWLIWWDIFVERVNREKSYADYANRHILEQMSNEEKNTKLSVSSPLIK